jgi:hypothetical protein
VPHSIQHWGLQRSRLAFRKFQKFHLDNALRSPAKIFVKKEYYGEMLIETFGVWPRRQAS